jgi:hypothetical protein
MIKILIFIISALVFKSTCSSVPMFFNTYYYICPTSSPGCYMDITLLGLDCTSTPNTALTYFYNTTYGVKICNSGYCLTETSTGSSYFYVEAYGTQYAFWSVYSGKYLYGTFTWPNTIKFGFCSTMFYQCEGS